jgi:hypothetical protein
MLPHSKGWLPVDAVVVDGRPGLWWMDMSDVSLSEPLFRQTVERAKAQNPDRGEVFTEFDVLLQLEKLLDSVAPTGFIFHSSRCGSTLVANACRAIANSIVLSRSKRNRQTRRTVHHRRTGRQRQTIALLHIPAWRGSRFRPTQIGQRTTPLHQIRLL